MDSTYQADDVVADGWPRPRGIRLPRSVSHGQANRHRGRVPLDGDWIKRVLESVKEIIAGVRARHQAHLVPRGLQAFLCIVLLLSPEPV